MTLSPLTCQLIIIDTIISHNRGCNWRAIKDAIVAHGYSPECWLSEARIHLQALINDRKVCRANTEEERYILCDEWY